MAFSPDGKTLVTGTADDRNHSAQVWDTHTSQPIGEPLQHDGHVQSATFSPDGKTILTGSFLQARLWDAATGRPIGPPMVHQGSVTSVAFSPDGKTILTASWSETAQLWDVATGRLIGKPLGGSVEHPDQIFPAAFSSDGKTVLTGSRDHTARLWDVATGLPLGLPLPHQGAVVAAAFSPDGQSVLSATMSGTARLWDLPAGLPIGQILEHGEIGPSILAFAPDGRTVLIGSRDRTARLWDVAARQPIGQPLPHPGEVSAAAFSPDGKTVLTGSYRQARLWDASSGHPKGSFPLGSSRHFVEPVMFSPDGRTFLTNCEDNAARLWDAVTGQLIGQPITHPGPVSAMAFSPDSKTILTASVRTAQLWDAITGRPIGQPIQQGPIVDVAFSPDGQTILIAESNNMAARLWDVSNGASKGAPMIHVGPLMSASFSPDGKTILTASRDGTARLWDTANGQTPRRIFRHQRIVNVACFSPDGKTILTASEDTTARLWDAGTGNPIGPALRHQAPVRRAGFSPDGKTIITKTNDNNPARLWDISLLPDDLPRIATWVEVLTGLELDEQGAVRVLDNASWLTRHERMQRLGGPPRMGPEPLLDPILFGTNPSARGRALMDLKRWDDAEAAFTEAIRSRPFNAAAWVERGRFHVARTQAEKAATDFEQAYVLNDRDPARVAAIVASEATVRRIIAQQPEAAADLWRLRAAILSERRQWTEAIACYTRSIEVLPTPDGQRSIRNPDVDRTPRLPNLRLAESTTAPGTVSGDAPAVRRSD